MPETEFMRQRIVERTEATCAGRASDIHCLPVENIAEIEITSEHPDRPIEGALSETGTAGSVAGSPGEQTITIVFDEPQRVRKMTLKFVESERSRTQEFVLTWASQSGSPPQVIVRQQWTFSPSGSTIELESYDMDLDNVREVALRIKPDLNDPTALATLAEWRIFS
jgi:hypothetical protein